MVTYFFAVAHGTSKVPYQFYSTIHIPEFPHARIKYCNSPGHTRTAVPLMNHYSRDRCSVGTDINVIASLELTVSSPPDLFHPEHLQVRSMAIFPEFVAQYLKNIRKSQQAKRLRYRNLLFSYNSLCKKRKRNRLFFLFDSA